jgi:hypothetical protein
MTLRKPRKRRPLHRSSTSWIRKSTRFAIYARDGFDCLVCRNVFPLAYDGRDLTLDHLIPRTHGGTDHPTNLITACHQCNSVRQHKPLSPAQLTQLQARAARPLNRALGLVYAKLYLVCRDASTPHPFTQRVIVPHPFDAFHLYQEQLPWEEPTAAG